MTPAEPSVPPRMKERILLVDDEPEIVSLLELALRSAGYTVVTAATGGAALREVRATTPDLVVLDWMLPDIPGTEVCRQLRRGPDTAKIPILMVSARGDEVDRVVGFELGVDDYVTKPFSPRELVLRIAALLRRSIAPAVPAAPAETVTLGVLRVDLGAHRVFVEDEEVELTALEFKLLVDLISRSGRVQTREALLERVWGYVPGIETRTVDTHVKRLREKLGAARDLIETVRGVGYRVPKP